VLPSVETARLSLESSRYFEVKQRDQAMRSVKARESALRISEKDRGDVLRKEFFAKKYNRRMKFPFELLWTHENMQGRLAKAIEDEIVAIFKDLSPLHKCLSSSAQWMSDRPISTISALEKPICSITWEPEDDDNSTLHNAISATSIILNDFVLHGKTYRRYHSDDKCWVQIDLASWKLTVSCTRMNITKTRTSEFVWGSLFKVPFLNQSCVTLNAVFNPLKTMPDNFGSASRLDLKVQRFSLRNSPEALRDDKELVMAVVATNGYALQYASKNLRADKVVVMTAVAANGYSLRYASEELRADRAVVQAAVAQNGYALRYISPSLSETLFDDLDWVENLFINHPSLRENRIFVQAAVQKNGAILKFVSTRLQGYSSVAIPAILNNDVALQYVPVSLKRRNGFLSSLLTVRKDLSNSKEFMLQSILYCPRIFEKCSENLKSDREFVLCAIKLRGRVLRWVHESLRADSEIVLTAVKENGSALLWAHEKFRLERIYVLAAVSSYGPSLQWAHDKFRSDKEVVIAALKSSAASIQFIHESFLNDEEVVSAYKDDLLASPRLIPRLLAYSPEPVRRNREVIISGYLQNPEVTEAFSLYKLTDIDKQWISCLSCLRDRKFSSFLEKRRYLKTKVTSIRQPSRFEISVSRQNLLESVVYQINAAPPDYLHEPFRVVFNNEPGKFLLA